MSRLFNEHPKAERELDGGEIRLPPFGWVVDDTIPQCVTRYVKKIMKFYLRVMLFVYNIF